MMSNLPSLERPPLGTRCPVCQEFQELENFCGVCGWSEEGLGEATAAALRADLPDRYEDRSSGPVVLFTRSRCRNCGEEYRRYEDSDGWCPHCSNLTVPAPSPKGTELLRTWASTWGQIAMNSMTAREPVSPNQIYEAARMAARYALDAEGRS